jgi:hypothetical protein
VNYFLRKNYPAAITSFEASLKEAHDPNVMVKTTDWLYCAYMHNGQLNDARRLLATVTTDSNSDHTQPYFQSIMLFKGLRAPDDFIDKIKSSEWIARQVIHAYDVATWFYFNGNTGKAKELYNKIIQTNRWATFRYQAAEVALME